MDDFRCEKCGHGDAEEVSTPDRSGSRPRWLCDDCRPVCRDGECGRCFDCRVWQSFACVEGQPRTAVAGAN